MQIGVALSQRPVVRGCCLCVEGGLVSLILHVGTMPPPSLTPLPGSDLAWCGSEVQLCLDARCCFLIWRWRRWAASWFVVAGGLPPSLCHSPGLNW